MVDISYKTAVDFGLICQLDNAGDKLNGKAIVLELAKSECVDELNSFLSIYLFIYLPKY